MSKNLKDKVIAKIEKEQIKVKSRYIFTLGSLLSGIGLFVSSAIVMLMLQLFLFRVTHPGYGATRKLTLLLTMVPWYLPLFAIMGILVGIALLRRYDFSYKRNFALILTIIFAGLVLGAVLLNQLGINDFLSRRGYFRDLYHNQGPGSGMREPQPRMMGR